MSVTVAGVVPKETWVCVCDAPILKRKDLQGTVDSQQWDHCARSAPQTQRKNSLMIAIINITPEGLGDGTSRYEVKVNHQTIAQFIHRPSDGLYRCLMRAAYAVLKK
jgi:hypothetical protein